MEYYVILGIGALVSIAFLCVGFVLGLGVYAHVYQHFLKRESERGAHKYAMAVNRARILESRLNEIKNRMVGQFGTEIPDERVSDEMERVLGATWSRKDGA